MENTRHWILQERTGRAKQMRPTTRIEEKPEGEFWLPCAACRRETKHRPLTSVVQEGPDEYWWVESWQVVQCSGCEALSFRKHWTAGEIQYIDARTGETEYEEKEEVYPPRAVGRSKLQDAHLLPFDVRTLYEETYVALCNSLTTLSIAGIRAIVDAVCRDKGAKGRNLEKKIESLVALGILTAALLHQLRKRGNVALHRSPVRWLSEVAEAFDVIEHVLQAVYIFPAQVRERDPDFPI